MMINCSKCGCEIPDNAAACPKCGSAVPNDKKQNRAQEAITSALEEGNENVRPKAGKEPLNNSAKKRKKKYILTRRGIYALVTLAGLLLVAMTVVAIMFVKNREYKDFALYLTENRLYYTDFSRSEPLPVSSGSPESLNFFKNLPESEESNKPVFTLSENGKLIIFSDYDTEAKAPALYVMAPEAESVRTRIGKPDNAEFSLSKNGRLIIWIEEGKLTRMNLRNGEKTEIDDNVSEFYASSDGKNIIYVKGDAIYSKKDKKDREKIESSGNPEIIYVNTKADTVFYMKEGSLFKRISGKEKERISDNVDSVIKVYEDGEAYFVTKTNRTDHLMEYIDDDMKNEDAVLTEPEYPDAPDRQDFEKYEDYQKACERYAEEVEIYKAKSDEYWAKVTRDDIRRALVNETFERTLYSLCYYDSKEAKVVAENYRDGSVKFAENTPAVACITYDFSGYSYVKLSEIPEAAQAYDIFNAAMDKTCGLFVIRRDIADRINYENPSEIRINKEGTVVYYLSECAKESDYSDLYRVAISKKEVSAPEKYDSNVYKNDLKLFGEDEVVYFKNVQKGHGILYMNKKQIDSDVSINTERFNEFSGRLIYAVDWSTTEKNGTYKVFTGRSSKKIADNMDNVWVTERGNIAYIAKKNTSDTSGTLYYFTNRKAKPYLEGVEKILAASK